MSSLTFPAAASGSFYPRKVDNIWEMEASFRQFCRSSTTDIGEKTQLANKCISAINNYLMAPLGQELSKRHIRSSERKLYYVSPLRREARITGLTTDVINKIGRSTDPILCKLKNKILELDDYLGPARKNPLLKKCYSELPRALLKKYFEVKIY